MEVVVVVEEEVVMVARHLREARAPPPALHHHVVVARDERVHVGRRVVPLLPLPLAPPLRVRHVAVLTTLRAAGVAKRRPLPTAARRQAAAVLQQVAHQTEAKVRHAQQVERRRRERGALGGEDALGAEEHVVRFLRLENVVEGFGDHRDLRQARVASETCAELRRIAPSCAGLRRTSIVMRRKTTIAWKTTRRTTPAKPFANSMSPIDGSDFHRHPYAPSALTIV